MSNEVAAEERKLVLDVDEVGAAALADLLSRASPKGRSELRLHSRLFKIVNTCRNFTSPTTFNWSASELTFSNKEEIAYLIRILEERVEAGVPGQASEAYTHIFEIVDKYTCAEE